MAREGDRVAGHTCSGVCSDRGDAAAPGDGVAPPPGTRFGRGVPLPIPPCLNCKHATRDTGLGLLPSPPPNRDFTALARTAAIFCCRSCASACVRRQRFRAPRPPKGSARLTWGGWRAGRRRRAGGAKPYVRVELETLLDHPRGLVQVPLVDRGLGLGDALIRRLPVDLRHPCPRSGRAGQCKRNSRVTCRARGRLPADGPLP